MNRLRVSAARRDARPPAVGVRPRRVSALRRRARRRDRRPVRRRHLRRGPRTAPRRRVRHARCRCGSSAPCTAGARGAGRRRWRPTTRRPAERPGPTLVDDFVATVADHRGRDRAPARPTRCRPTRSAGRRRWPRGTPTVAGASAACRCGCSRSGRAAGSTCAGTATGTTPATSTLGDPASAGALRGELAGRRAPGFPTSGPCDVVERAGCDRNPIDVGTDEGRTTLRAYLWPDQVERRARLEAAFAVAAAVPGHRRAGRPGGVGGGPAGRPRARGWPPWWPTRSCGSTCRGASRDRLRAALAEAGARATADAPLAWLRMEPAGAVGRRAPHVVARGRARRCSATAGYHGIPVYWGAPTG